MSEAALILQRHAQAVGQRLESLLAEQPGAPAALIEAIRYSLLNEGKRLRPTLVLESFIACRGESPAHDSAMSAACAIELIHTFSLVHDDLPAMDDDDLRRGRPTNHKVFGEAMAILAGDAMVSMAFDCIARHANPSLVPQLVAELARATGPAGMIGGQVLDVAGENQSLDMNQLREIHRMKTGALLTTSCRLGAIAAGTDETSLKAITRFGQHLGLAFQIVDDILDVTSTPEQLGKKTNKDANRGKNTYPALLGIETSRAQAREQLDHALAAISSFDARAESLRVLARFTVERNV